MQFFVWRASIGEVSIFEWYELLIGKEFVSKLPGCDAVKLRPAFQYSGRIPIGVHQHPGLSAHDDSTQRQKANMETHYGRDRADRCLSA